MLQYLRLLSRILDNCAIIKSNSMNTSAERILLVESDPDIKELIAHQALQPLSYQVHTVADVNEALMQAAQFAPDLVIADLNLPGLSGKDLLVAFNSRGLQVPIIVIAEKGQENSVIQAFRLGAIDYLLWPAREAEIVSAVERALTQVRESRTRQRLDLQLKEINQELHRVRELTASFAIGKAVLSITDQSVLFDKIVERVMFIAEADYSWLLLRDERTRTFILAAHRNLPDAWAEKIGQPLDDGISAQVALSGETLAVHGEPLKHFNVASLGLSVMAVPIKIQQEVIGLLEVVRKSDQAFENTMQSVLGAVADYASISLVNAHLFRTVQESADAAQAGEKKKVEQLRELESLLQSVTYPIDLLLSGKMGRLTTKQQQALETAQSSLDRAAQLVAASQLSQPTADQPKDSG
jgi:two-component system NtrC family sensor kinase